MITTIGTLYLLFRNNFDLEKVNIKAYLRDPNLVDKNADFYTIYNALNNSAALQQVHRKYNFGSIEFYSPIVGAPRKLTQDLGVIASDGTVVSHYGGSQIQFWYKSKNKFGNECTSFVCEQEMVNLDDSPTVGPHIVDMMERLIPTILNGTQINDFISE